MLRTVIPVIGSFALTLFTPGAAAQTAPEPLIFAVHPYLPPAEIVKRFTPLAERLAHATGRPVAVRVGRNYAEHIDAVGTDGVDLAYLGPASYVKLVSRYGKKPLLARQEVSHQPYLRGVIVVRQDSPLNTLAQLKGKRFAFGDPDSTMSHVVPQQMLERAGVPERALAHREFLGAHKNVALAVLAGDYDAGAVKQEVFTEFAPKGLRALATSPPVADHVLVASTRLPAALVETLRRTLWQLSCAPEDKMILTAIHTGLNALVPAADADYDGLRAIVGSAPSPAR